jgi:hypothetical protein
MKYMIAALAIAAAVMPVHAANENDNGRPCSVATLKGKYGLLASGVRPAPGGKESFVTVGVRTYDGNGGFHTVSDDHGSVVQSSFGITATGTYTVNTNCSGKTEITIATPGGPVKLESSFVVVDNGKQVKEASMSPPPAIATAVLTRIE